MSHEKFDVARLESLNDPARFQTADPEVMWDALGRPAPSTIVEIGSGTGLYAERFASMAPGATVYAADIEPDMVKWMREHRAGGDRPIVPLLAGETTVPLEDGIADIVLMLNLHHELADPRASYAEALRLLRPDGSLLVSDWLPDAPSERPPRHVRVSAEDIAGFLDDAGFIDVQTHAESDTHSLVTGRRP